LKIDTPALTFSEAKGVIDPDLKTTLREFKEYVALSCESPREIAARVGVVQKTIWDWLAGRKTPTLEQGLAIQEFLKKQGGAKPRTAHKRFVGPPRFTRQAVRFIECRGSLFQRAACNSDLEI